MDLRRIGQNIFWAGVVLAVALTGTLREARADKKTTPAPATNAAPAKAAPAPARAYRVVVETTATAAWRVGAETPAGEAPVAVPPFTRPVRATKRRSYRMGEGRSTARMGRRLGRTPAARCARLRLPADWQAARW